MCEVVGNSSTSYSVAVVDAGLAEPQFILEHNSSIEIFQKNTHFVTKKEMKKFCNTWK
jgi:hypothetical protein